MNRISSIETEYEAHDWYCCIASYKAPDGEWGDCPCCGLRLKVWCFDNGRSTVCGCWMSEYNHSSIHAENIMSVYNRTDGRDMTKYDSDALCGNWNYWCKTGVVLFEPECNRNNGRW